MKTKQFLYLLGLLINLLLFYECADKQFIEIPDKTDMTTSGTISGIVSNSTNITPCGLAQRTDGKYIIVYGDANNGLKSVNMNGNQIVNSSLVSYNVGQVVINSSKLTPDNNILLIGNNKTNDSVFVGLIKTETQALEWNYKIASPTASPAIGQDIVAQSPNIFYAVVSNAPNKPFVIVINPNEQKKEVISIDSMFKNRVFTPSSITSLPDGSITIVGNCNGVLSKYYYTRLKYLNQQTWYFYNSTEDSIIAKVTIDNSFKIKVHRLYEDQLIYVSTFGAGHLFGPEPSHIEDIPYSDASINSDSTVYLCGNNAVVAGNQLVVRKVNLEMQDRLPVKRISNITLALKAHKIMRSTDGGYLLLATATQTGSNTSLYIVKADKDGTIQ
ncbi:MAG: hypothetical protein JNL70_06200 [Saprospiraceae bacterium]|nr:hypothetical protein [Saprospiraceae bacterium]